MIKIILLLFVTKIVLGLEGYDCSLDGSAKVFSLSNSPVCIKQSPTNQQCKNNSVIIAQMPPSSNHLLESCQIYLKRTSYYCTWLKFTTPIIDEHSINEFQTISITPEECQTLWNKGTIIVEGIKVYGTKEGEIDIIDSDKIGKDGLCHSYMEEITITFIRVALLTRTITTHYNYTGHVISIMEDGSNLFQIDKSNAYTRSDNTVYINTDTLKQICSLNTIYKGIVQSYLENNNQTTLIIPNRSVGVALKGQVSRCGILLFQTNDPFLYVTFDMNTSLPLAPFGIEISFSSLLVTTMTQVVHSLDKKTNDIYNNINSNLCLLESSLKREMLSSLEQFPDTAGYKLTGELGWSMVQSGEAVSIQKCKPVNIKIRETNSCYLQVPVKLTLNEGTKFMHPITRILTNNSIEIDCLDPRNPHFKIRQKWYRMNPQLITVGEPLEYTGRLETIHLEPSVLEEGLYSKELIFNSINNLDHHSSHIEQSFKLTKSIIKQFHLSDEQTRISELFQSYWHPLNLGLWMDNFLLITVVGLIWWSIKIHLKLKTLEDKISHSSRTPTYLADPESPSTHNDGDLTPISKKINKIGDYPLTHFST